MLAREQNRMLRAQVSEASEEGIGAGFMDLGIELVHQRAPRHPKYHSHLQPVMFGRTVQVPSLSHCEPTRKDQSSQRHTCMSPNHMPVNLMSHNVLFSSTLLKACPFSEEHLEAASSVSSVLLLESLCVLTTQAIPSLKEWTACLSSLLPMVPSHLDPDL